MLNRGDLVGKIVTFRGARLIAVTVVSLVLCQCDVLSAKRRRQLGREQLLKVAAYAIKPVIMLPHDIDSYTQGLLFSSGDLFESTGLYGGSAIRRLDGRTGSVIVERDLPDSFFAEGITAQDGLLYQFTWRNGVVLTWDLSLSLEPDKKAFPHEVWGVTTDDDGLIVMSNGTSILQFLEPKRLKIVRTLEVRLGGLPVDSLNELEWVRGEVWANVLPTDRVIRIDPSSGQVIGSIQVSVPPTITSSPARAANGIAFDPSSRLLAFTGKHWAKIIITSLDDLCRERPRDGYACSDSGAMR